MGVYTGTGPTSPTVGGAISAAAFGVPSASELQALASAWTAYTPALTATTTNPTLGTGAIQTGRYTQIGKFCVVRAQVTMGTSGFVAGSGSYLISLPVTPQVGAFSVVGTGWFFDSSATTYTPVIARTNSTGLLIEFIYPATWPNGAATNISATTPVVPAASDQLGFNITLEVA